MLRVRPAAAWAECVGAARVLAPRVVMPATRSATGLPRDLTGVAVMGAYPLRRGLLVLM